MSVTTYRTEWYAETIEVGADWAQAAYPVHGDAHGRQVADFQHDGLAALRAAVEDAARADGIDPETTDGATEIDEAMSYAIEDEDTLP